jgi:LysM repeat protein
MKEPSPLVPQGSFEAQARTKSRVKLAFYTIVAIHVLAIAGFLIIGCKRDEKDGLSNVSPPSNDLTNTPAFGSDPAVVAPALTNTNPATGLPPVAPPTNPVTALTPPAVPFSNPPATDTPPVVITEHTIVKNDSFSTLAAKYGVSIKAIQAANPNLNPTRLKIGDKVKIPAKTAALTTQPGNGTAATVSDPSLYTVKSGDSLERIAKAHKTTVKELQKLNNLTTTQIKVGQKLKMPQPAVAPTVTTPPPAQ